MSIRTPGPWKIVSDPTRVGGRFAVRVRGYEVSSEVRRLADAYLIATAPDLFEFAKTIFVALGAFEEGEPRIDDPKVIVELCRRAMPAIESFGTTSG